MRMGVVLVWACLATIVLIGAGIFGTLVVSGRVSFVASPTPSTTPVVEVTPVIDTSYSVLVLNATGEAGLATEAKDTLLARGWSDANVTAGNASSSDFPTTTVYYAVPAAEAAARGLADLLGASETALDPDYPLPGTPATQLTVVLGLDRVNGGSPSPTP